MKKKIIILSTFLAFISYAKEIEGKVKIGFSASYGVEGLSDINIDKLGTIKMFMKKVDKPTTNNMDKFVESIVKIDKIERNKKKKPDFEIKIENPKIKTKTKKELIKELALHGLQLDATLFDGYIKMNNINTTIGAKIYGKTSRIGEDIKLYEVGRAKVFANLDTKKIKLNNTIYVKGYDKKLIGLDKYRVEDVIDGKSIMEFDSEGIFSPFNTAVRPELAYKLNIGNRKEFLISPGISLNLLDNENSNLILTANYYASTYINDKLNIDEIKHDLKNIAPGNTKVEYFKNWELGKTRDITQGILDGKKGSTRAIGYSTGALYGENIVDYAMKRAYKQLIDETGEAGKKLNEIIKRIREEKGEIKLEDVLELATKENQKIFEDIEKKLPKLYYDFLNDALLELGIKPQNEEISSYHISQYIPNNSLDYIQKLANDESSKKGQDKNLSKKENKYGDLEYLFPNEELEEITKIIEAQKLIDSINKIEKIAEDSKSEIEYFSKMSEDLKNKNTLEKGLYILSHKNDLIKNIQTIETKIKNEKETIQNTLDESIKMLETITEKDKDSEEIKETVKYLKERQNSINKALDMLDKGVVNSLKDDGLNLAKNKLDESVNKIKQIGEEIKDIGKQIWNKITCIFDTKCEEKREKQKKEKEEALKKLKEEQEKLKKEFDKKVTDYNDLVGTISSFKDINKNYKSRIDGIVNITGTRIAKKATDIIFAPEKVSSFDMLRGLNIVKSEHDAVKYEYEEKMLKKLEEDSYKLSTSGFSHGLNINLLYTNKENLYNNTNFDFARYSKNNSKMTRLGLNNTLSYTPNKYSFISKVGLIYKDITLNDLEYSKYNIDIDTALKLNFRTKNEKFLFRPGLRYVGNFEYVNTKNSVVEVEIFKRDKGGNLIDKSGNSVDISKESRYKYDKDLKKSFETEKVTKSSKWLKPTNTIIPTMDMIYTPIENVSLEYNLLVPVKFVGNKFDGVMIKNGVGVTIKF